MINLTTTQPDKLISALYHIKGEQTMHGKIDTDVTISRSQAEYLSDTTFKMFSTNEPVEVVSGCLGKIAGFNIYLEEK